VVGGAFSKLGDRQNGRARRELPQVKRPNVHTCTASILAPNPRVKSPSLLDHPAFVPEQHLRPLGEDPRDKPENLMTLMDRIDQREVMLVGHSREAVRS
jgi:hypothetical protein